ncbi:MAG: type II toxin-antitoxin system VapC family toxin, partial [Longimicrobiales bacterium]
VGVARTGIGAAAARGAGFVKCVLDTHFLLWILLEAERLAEFPWLDDYRPWGVSPVSLLEVQFLAEAGKLEVRSAELVDALSQDLRFIIDEVPLLQLVRHAHPLSWTRDPFDRLLAAHSSARRLPLCTLDRLMLKHHRDVPDPLRSAN